MLNNVEVIYDHVILVLKGVSFLSLDTLDKLTICLKDSIGFKIPFVFSFR